MGKAGRLRFTLECGHRNWRLSGGKETRAALVKPGAERSSETYVWVCRHCMLEAVNVCHQYNELCSSSRELAFNFPRSASARYHILNLVPSSSHPHPNHSSNHTTACTNALSFANRPSLLSRSPRTANPCTTPPYKHTCHGCPTSARIPSVSDRFSAGNI